MAPPLWNIHIVPKQIKIQHNHKPKELEVDLDNTSRPIQSANSFFHFMRKKNTYLIH